MARHRIFATFADGITRQRRTEADYNFAAKNTGGRVTYHASQDAAERSAGLGGEVVPTTTSSPTNACVVCRGHGWYAAGPRATTGDFYVVSCHRCR